MERNNFDILNQSLLLFLNGIENALNDFQMDKSNYPPLNIYVEKDNEENIENEQGNLIFEIAVAGFDPEKIKEGIKLENNILTIKVDKISDNDEKNYLVKKLAYRQIDRSFKIPMAISEVDVEVNNGILKITLYPNKEKININIK